MNWQIGALRNLPQGYGAFLEMLTAISQEKIGYSIQDETAYVYGRILPASDQWGGEEAVLYMSMPLGADGVWGGK